MNIRRLFRWLDQLSIDDAQIHLAKKCRQQFHDFSLDHDHENGFSFSLGGMVGPLAVLRVREADCSEHVANRIVLVAIEGAARVGLAYSFHPQHATLVSCTEDLIAAALIAGIPLESVAHRVQRLFSCIPKEKQWSSLWFQEIRSAVEYAHNMKEKGGVDLEGASLSIEPLYHQERCLSETLVHTTHSLRIDQQTVAQGIVSILERHIKAAGKRLRSDQIARVEIDLLSGICDSDLIKYLASLLIFYPDPIPDPTQWSPKQESAMSNILNVIQIKECDWEQHWRMNYQTLGRLYSTATSQERKSWMKNRGNLGIMRFFFMERALKNSMSIEEFSFVYPVSLRLYTTRGGCWKETIERLEEK